MNRVVILRLHRTESVDGAPRDVDQTSQHLWPNWNHDRLPRIVSCQIRPRDSNGIENRRELSTGEINVDYRPYDLNNLTFIHYVPFHSQRLRVRKSAAKLRKS